MNHTGVLYSKKGREVRKRVPAIIVKIEIFQNINLHAGQAAVAILLIPHALQQNVDFFQIQTSLIHGFLLMVNR